MGIHASAMLVELNISVWTANRIDKDATRKVVDDNNASTGAGHFRKNLLVGTNVRKDIADFAASCRLWHNVKTMPWADRGARLLPTSLFMDYRQEMGARQRHYESLVSDFLTEYPNLRASAAANLGSLYNAEDYPGANEVGRKFSFNMVFSPVPEAGDFRVDIPARELSELRNDYDSAFNLRLADAMREPWERLHDMLKRMTGKLTESDDPEAKRRWHDTFLTNAEDLCELLDHLNITKDAKLAQAKRDLQRVIGGVDIESIKESEAARSEMKDKLDNILKSYNW